MATTKKPTRRSSASSARDAGKSAGSGRRGAPPERLWKPGQSGNPQGGRLHDPEMKALKALTKKELVEIGNLVVKGNVAELKAVAGDPGASVIKTMIAAVAVKIIQKGDMNALNVLLDRLVGKVKDEVHHSGEMPRITVTLPANGREAKAG